MQEIQSDLPFIENDSPWRFDGINRHSPGLISMFSGSNGANNTSAISFGNGSAPSPWNDADQSWSAASTGGILAESNPLPESAIGVASLEDADETLLPSAGFNAAVEALLGLPAVFEAVLADVDGPARSHADAKVRTGALTGRVARPTEAA